MRRAAFLVIAVTCAVPAGAQAPPPVAGDRPSCVDVTFAALYRGLGYNHLVTLHNGCTQTAACSVHTDVSPSPQSVTVATGATEVVTTFMGSPARVFVPTVACTLRH